MSIFLYNGKETLSLGVEKKMIEIIGSDWHPKFSIIKNETPVPKKSKYSDTYILISNFESVTQVNELVRNFCTLNSDKEINYLVKVRKDSSYVYFDKVDDAFDFIKYATLLKFSDKKYKRLKIQFRYTFIDLRNKGLKLNNKVLRSSSDKKPLYSSRREYHKKDLDNYYSTQKYIRNSSPYMSVEDIRHLNDRENKKKWLTPKGFFCCVGKNFHRRNQSSLPEQNSTRLPKINMGRVLSNYFS